MCNVRSTVVILFLLQQMNYIKYYELKNIVERALHIFYNVTVMVHAYAYKSRAGSKRI